MAHDDTHETDQKVSEAAEQVAKASGIFYGHVQVNIVAGVVKSVTTQRSIQIRKPQGGR